MQPEISLAHTLLSSPGVFALLLGSGVSRQSGIPTGWEVTVNLVERVALMSAEDTAGDPVSWYAKKFGREPGYSDLIDKLAGTQAERRAILHEFFEPTSEEREEGLKRPTDAHRAIADMVNRGTIKVILTTNFDKLMEVALTDIGIVPVVISGPDAIKGAAPLVHQRCVIVKVHGDYLDDRIKNTEAELGAYAPEMDAYLDRVFDEFGLLICGWSGEWDQALRSAIERCPNRRYSTYWASPSPLSPRAQKLLTLRGGSLIKIRDADQFFKNLADMTEALERSKASLPFSAPALVAQVKKYAGDPIQRVRFNDVIVDEAIRVAAEFDKTYPLLSKPYDDAQIKARVNGYDAIMKGLRHAVYAGAAWAGTESFGVISRAVQTILPRGRQSGMGGWIELSKYPATAALYSAALGAADYGNWGMFGYLLDARIRFDDREEEILDTLGAGHVIEERIGRAIVNSYTPISERLLSVLADLDARQDFERIYDRLEVLIGLHYLSKTTENSQRYTIRGRYIWNHGARAIASVREEIEREGDSWPPLKAGLLGGKAVAALEIINELRKNVSNIAPR